jgi:hypothetical protein
VVASRRPLLGLRTRTAPSLLLRLRGSLPVLVTPDDPDAVVAALRQAGVSA